MQLPYRKPGKFSQTPLDPILSKEKFEALTRKLERLQHERPVLAKEVARLAELGDFSENVEYQLAKGKLRSNNERILIIENQLKHAEVLVPQKKHDIVAIGDTVVIEANNTQKTYQILGSSETDPKKGIISYNSPLGTALVGKKVGDVIVIHAGTEDVSYTIRSIT